MPKRVTTLVMAVRLELPTGATGKDALDFVREALNDHRKLVGARLNDTTSSTHPMRGMTEDSIKVSLIEKTTRYK